MVWPWQQVNSGGVKNSQEDRQSEENPNDGIATCQRPI